MNRSNIGNITTNAVQTLSISGTTVAGMKRAKDRADLALNAKEEQSAMNLLKQEETKSRIAKNKAQEEATKLRAERTKQIIEKNKDKDSNIVSVDDIMRDISEQGPHISTKINNDISYNDFYKQLGKADKSDIPEILKAIGGKTDASKDV